MTNPVAEYVSSATCVTARIRREWWRRLPGCA
jgi:hypothetical protein